MFLKTHVRHLSFLGFFFIIVLNFTRTGDIVVEIACMPIQVTYDFQLCCPFIG